MQSLTIIIPSRDRPRQVTFLERAVQSIRAQTFWPNFEIDIVVGLDRGVTLPRELCDRLGIRFVQSDGSSQAEALNSSASDLKGEYLAFLEDDDRWHPKYLEFAVAALRHGDFVSSTQLDVNETGGVIRINDFPTPSGWMMKSETWAKVGNFNAEFRFHLDNEWLGRLAENRISRVHMVEATAPVDYRVMLEVRPWLANLVRYGGGDINRFYRHDLPVPLVARLVHLDSGMAQIVTKPELRARSHEEREMLMQRFQHIPS